MKLDNLEENAEHSTLQRYNYPGHGENIFTDLLNIHIKHILQKLIWSERKIKKCARCFSIPFNFVTDLTECYFLLKFCYRYPIIIFNNEASL